MPGEVIPVVMFGMAGLIFFSYSPIGKALARRLSGEKDSDAAAVDELREEIAELRRVMEDREDRRGTAMDELHNRLDFAERMLAQGRARGAIASPQEG